MPELPSRNRGIELARGDLIAFLDADDLWLPGFLDAVLALEVDFPQAQWFATGYEIRGARGFICRPATRRTKGLQARHPARLFHRGNTVNPACLVISGSSAARRHSNHRWLSGGH